MRKGHKRTQSAFNSNTNEFDSTTNKHDPISHQIFRLLEASEQKVQSKIVNYEKLQINAENENNFLVFGNTAIKNYSTNIPEKNCDTLIAQTQEQLLCIPENNKSSEISSQGVPKGRREDEIPVKAPPKRRIKRNSDFSQFESIRHRRGGSSIQQQYHPVGQTRSIKTRK